MSQEVAQQERGPIAQLRDVLASEQSLQQFEAALPENVSVRKFQRALLTAVNEKPDEMLAVYQENPASLFSALTRCASAGLLPDGRQAAINVYRSKVKRDGREVYVQTAQFLPMIGGLRLTLARYGWTLETAVVYTNDSFAYTEQPPTLSHARTPFGTEKGQRCYAYAIATHRDGRRMQRVIDADRVAKSRKLAKTDNIWKTWEDQMWEKTVGHDLFEDIPLGDLEAERIKALLADTGLAADPVAAIFGAKTAPAALNTGAHGEDEETGPERHAAPLDAHGPVSPAGDPLSAEPASSPNIYDQIGGNASTADDDTGPDEQPLPGLAADPGSAVVPGGPWKGETLRACSMDKTPREGPKGPVLGEAWLRAVYEDDGLVDEFAHAVAAWFEGQS